MPRLGRGALLWSVVAGCCWTAAAQVNGAIGGHQHTHTAACGSTLSGGYPAGQALVVENDQSVQTSVETISTTGVTGGYTTYTITLHLQSNALNCYTIYGDSRPLMFPPAYQVPTPFGANVGGVPPAFFALNPLAQYDSWLTVGVTAGNSENSVNSVGIDFGRWTDTMPLISSVDSGGAVFWMDPDSATQAVKPDRTMVIAQLTLRDADSQAASQAVHFDAQGRSSGHLAGSGGGPGDWEENCIEVLVGGPQNGQGSHSVMVANPAPVPGGPCVMKTNPQGGVWDYDSSSFASGSHATLSCMQGYSRPVGATMQSTCANGQWTDAHLARCDPDQPCSLLPDPTAGMYIYPDTISSSNGNTHDSGSRATLTCRAGYYLTTGNAVKICDGGNWVVDSDADPSYTLSNFATCRRVDAAHVGQEGQYDSLGHDAVRAECQHRREEYIVDRCFLDETTYDQRTQQQCSQQGPKCRWVVDLTVDGAHPTPGRGLSCEHCASVAKTEVPVSPGDDSGSRSGIVVVVLVLLAGGVYVAHDKKLGPFASTGEKSTALTGGAAGSATIYDTQTDESL